MGGLKNMQSRGLPSCAAAGRQASRPGPLGDTTGHILSHLPGPTSPTPGCAQAVWLQKVDPKTDGAARDWVAIYDECSRILYQEIDYTLEGRNADA